MQQIAGILIAIIILSLMLFLHELGHFIAGRKLGFKIEEFSIFMGPRLLSWEKNGIRYSLKAFPIGASVAFAGEFPEDEDEDYKLSKGDFLERPIWARFITYLAGPMMNIVTALLLFAVLFASLGFATTEIASVQDKSLASEAHIKPGEKIFRINDEKVRTDLDLQIALTVSDPTKGYTIETLTPEGDKKVYQLPYTEVPAYKMGVVFDLNSEHPSVAKVDTKVNPAADMLVLGDQILAVDGEALTSQNAVEVINRHISSKPLKVKLLRGSEEKVIELPTAKVMQSLPLGLALSPNQSAWEAIPYTFSYIGSYVKGTFKILGQVFTGQVKASETLTGPVGIVDMFSGVVTAKVNIGFKLAQVLRLFAVISLALGVTNLLPIAPLDGGGILLLLLEKIRGKRLSIKAQSAVTIAGVVFILALAVMALGFDIKRIITR